MSYKEFENDFHNPSYYPDPDGELEAAGAHPVHRARRLPQEPAALDIGHRKPLLDKLNRSQWRSKVWGLPGLFLALLCGAMVCIVPRLFAGDVGLDIFKTGISPQKQAAICAMGLSMAVLVFQLAWLAASRVCLVPKSLANLIYALTLGFPSGSIMISYCWRGGFGKEAVQTFARLFPCRWLDKDSLVSGVDVTRSCEFAARHCRLGILFITRQYLLSPICQIEFRLLHETHGRKNIYVVHPEISLSWTDIQVKEMVLEHLVGRAHGQQRAEADLDPEQQAKFDKLVENALHVLASLRELREQDLNDENLHHPQSQGHLTIGQSVFLLSEQESLTIASNPSYAAFVMLHKNKTFPREFEFYTPALYGKWYATAGLLCPKVTGNNILAASYMHTFIFLLGWSLFIFALLSGEVSVTAEETRVARGYAFVCAVVASILAWLLFPCLTGAFFSNPFNKRDRDVAYLLIVLVQLELVSRHLTVFSGTNCPVLHLLSSTECIDLVEDPGNDSISDEDSFSEPAARANLLFVSAEELLGVHPHLGNPTTISFPCQQGVAAKQRRARFLKDMIVRSRGDCDSNICLPFFGFFFQLECVFVPCDVCVNQ
eukprot:m.192013 g.192013  ORF g.192013 m.192013 type:complete len:601 (+) comp21730_c1_seq6:615-2417(+)